MHANILFILFAILMNLDNTFAPVCNYFNQSPFNEMFSLERVCFNRQSRAVYMEQIFLGYWKGDPPFTDHHLTSLEKLALADPVEQPTWPYLRNFRVPSNSFNTVGTVESFLVQSTTTTTLLASPFTCKVLPNH